MLQNKVAVEQHRLDFGQQVVTAVEICPPRLHHSDLFVREVVDGALKEIDRRDEVRVEDRDNFNGRGLQAILKSECLVTLAIGSMNVLDRISGGAVFTHQTLGKGMGIVG